MSRESYADWKEARYCTNCGTKLKFEIKVSDEVRYDSKTGKKQIFGRTIKYCPKAQDSCFDTLADPCWYSWRNKK